MGRLSNHTLLMNQVIAFSKKTSNWPAPLSELGYSLQFIEPVYPTPENTINPDLVFESNKLNHALLIDCKSNTIKTNQLERYKETSVDSVKAKTSVIHRNHLSFDICFFSNSTKPDVIIREINKIKKWPVLLTEKNTLTKHNDFEKQELNDKFLEDIPLPKNPPTFYYPFSNEDDPAVIAPFVFQTMVHLALQKKKVTIDIDAILEETHKCWDLIQEKRKNGIKKKVKAIINDFSKKGLSNHLQKISNADSWKITTSAIALQKKCSEIMEHLEQQTKLKTN